MELGQDVTVLRGKHKGKKGYLCCFVEPHPLSSKRRCQVRVWCADGHGCARTILINEDGISPDER